MKVIVIIAAILLNSFNFASAFTLRDIEKKCEVWRWSDNFGDIECRGSDLKIIEKKCEAYFWNRGDDYGDVECRGSDLKIIEKECEVWMWSDDWGDIDC
tara:strand:+ start:157 stop:453 length:297 start_codon:yes stop_codon:yes gene_type:complete